MPTQHQQVSATENAETALESASDMVRARLTGMQTPRSVLGLTGCSELAAARRGRAARRRTTTMTSASGHRMGEIYVMSAVRVAHLWPLI